MAIHLLPEEHRGILGKSGVLEHKSRNISETRQDRAKITMEGLWEVTNALSNGSNPDRLRPPLPQDWGFATPKLQSLLSRERATDFKCAHCVTLN